MKSPLNYFGGKSRLSSQIIQHIPEHTCYCEPFAGGAWVLFAKEPSQVEVINDLDKELVTFWRVIQNHMPAFLELLKWAVSSRKVFDWENAKLPDTLTDLQRAVRYYYIQRLGYGGRATKRTYGYSAMKSPKFNIAQAEETLMQVHWRLSKVNVECLDAFNVMTRYDRPTTFFFIDPPYYDVVQAYEHKFQDFQKLADFLPGLKGKFLLTLNDHPDVRRIFAAFHQKRVSITYSIVNGRSAARGKQHHELFITNYPTLTKRAS